MKKIKVKLAGRSYPIIFDGFDSERFDGEVKNLAGSGSILTVSEKKIQELYPLCAYKYGEFFALQGGENHKSFSEIERLSEFAVDKKFDRKSLFIALGGGIIGDMTGFAAAIFMRGVDFIQVPTTLLAMVDSSVGGKTGVNLASGKNLIGAFHQPKAVLIDVNFLRTLPERELKNGLGEIVKYGAALDKDFFAKLEKNIDKLKNHDWSFYAEIIADCCAVKADIVAQDEQENGVRALLNYGHTFGHAIENLSEYSISHGEGVAIGMNIAGKLSEILKLWSPGDFLRQRRLLEKLELKSRIPVEIKKEKILELMMHDKKARHGRIKFILPDMIGGSQVVSNVTDEQILTALEQSYE